MNKQIAHFFWQGDMTLFERQCIRSFIRYNFDVNVWSYQSLDLPEGARLRDASEILPISELNTFKVWSPEANAYVEVGGINSGFSDLFRYNLLMREGGWWFDADVVCLRDQSEFAPLLKDKHIIAGMEDLNNANGAILSFPSKETNALALQKCIDLCNSTRDLPWGAVGPGLITSFVIEQNLQHEVYDKYTFYPVDWNEIPYYFDPSLREHTEQVCHRAYTTHLWNWVIVSKHGLNKNIMPPVGSYLHSIFDADMN